MADDIQNLSSKLKDMPEKYRQIKDESHEFIRKLYTFTRNYQDQLLKYNGIELEPLVDFLIKTVCKDEPKVDKDGNPILDRITPIHGAFGALRCESVRDDVKKIFPGLGARLFLGVDTRLTAGSLLQYHRQEAKE
ncbi:hypothetical protein TKK_0001001 [Trichogramma kaykai]